MSKTLSFIGLDFSLIRPYRLSILLLLVLGVGMGFGFKSTGMLASYFMMSLMLIMSYPFAVGEKNGLDTLYGTLSLGRKHVVAGRYGFVLTLEAVFMALALLCSRGLSFVINTGFNVAHELAALGLLSGVFSLVVAIQYPIYFKHGYNKAKIMALVPLLVVSLAVIQLPALAKLFGFNFTWEALFAGIMDNPFLMCVVPAALGPAMLALSCAVSCKIYSKRDI